VKRTEVERVPQLPRELSELVRNSKIYDSSCSSEARVYFVERDGGIFLKSAPAGDLKKEAEMTRYFHSKGLAAEVLCYLPSRDGRDWLVTSRVAGEDLTHALYTENPARLCDSFAEALVSLHSLDFSDCPVRDRMTDYFALAEKNYRRGVFEREFLVSAKNKSLTPDEAFKRLCRGRDILTSDTLIHGDYCLPNIIFDDWRFSGFIDLGNGGVGDRHIDIFWGIWTLEFNLKTDKYRERFIDAYGRDKVNPEALEIIEIAESFG